MSMASTSRLAFNSNLRKGIAKPLSDAFVVLPTEYNLRTVAARSYYGTAASRVKVSPLETLRNKQISGTARYATAAFTEAKPNAAHLGNVATNAKTSSDSKEEEKPDWDPDEPPKKATIRERLRFLSRRYGWWALAVYLLASLADFSLVFGAIHMLGADHIRDLEDRFRNYIGVGRRELADHEVAVWPVPIGSGVSDGNSDVNNLEAARIAAEKIKRQDPEASTTGKSSSSSSGGSGTLWTEAVLAYTIHKTLLLPFRVGVTAAITPSFVKYMVKLGWAKDNAAVQRAAHKVKMARDAAKVQAKAKA